MQLVDDPGLLPPWLPRPGAATVADQVPLDLYPEVVRLPFLHDPPDEDPTWPQPLRAEWATLRLCDVLDAPAPFDEGPSERQLAALLPLLLAEDQQFWFLAADGADEVELFVRLGRLALPGDRGVEGGRSLARVLRDLAIPASSVSGDAEVSRFWLRTAPDHRRLNWRYSRSRPLTCGPNSGYCGCTDGATRSSRC